MSPAGEAREVDRSEFIEGRRVAVRVENSRLLHCPSVTLSANPYLPALPSREPGPCLELQDPILAGPEVRRGEILTVYGRATYEADPDPRALGAAPYRVAPLRCVFVATPSSPLYLVQERVVALDAVE